MSEALEIVKAAGFNLSALTKEQVEIFAARILNNGWFRAEWRNPIYLLGRETYPTAVDVLRVIELEQLGNLRMLVEANSN